MRKAFLSMLGLLFLSSVGFTQSNMDSLVFWSSHFLDKKLSDDKKTNDNEKFTETLAEELTDKISIDQTYADLKSVSVQTAPDNSFRIFTWFTLHKNGYQAHGLVQTTSKKFKSPIVTPLNDQGEEIKSVEFKTLNAKNWFGALYYNMIPFKIKGKKYWILLGFNPGNGLSHKKVIDIVQIMNNGQPRFGMPVFEKEKKMASRIVLEYDARAKITLQYNEALKMIVFDHLVPQRPELADQHQFYVPDLSYDAFELVKTSWAYKPDVDARNATEELGSQGDRLIIDGVNDQHTLENKMSGGGNDPKKKEEK
jgi:hypothetical protein